MNFTKMHGLGNDFIVIDCRELDIPNLTDVMKKLSHRQFGIGFDQALILYNSNIADFKMDIYNADGGRVEMCGNGIRCFAKYIWDRNLSVKNELAIETLAGIIKPKIPPNPPLEKGAGYPSKGWVGGDFVQVDMGEPILEGRKIPVNLDGKVIDYALHVGDEIFLITSVSMGNPHCVIFVQDIDKFPVKKIGAMIEKHPFFPKRTNVEFIQVINKKELKMRVWERGSGETLACGTGACASLVAANIKGLADREAVIHLLGGDLQINWSKEDNHVYMTGPAAEVFEGVVEV
ncbi:MAG: diaminopimelate epimerase [Deltaproteobacteria bacterium]|nr:diaminopimelate epimerase [Deltaproteobacteria bacterium]